MVDGCNGAAVIMLLLIANVSFLLKIITQ